MSPRALPLSRSRPLWWREPQQRPGIPPRFLTLTRGFPGGGGSHGLRLALPAGAALTPQVGALGAAPASCRASVPTTRPGPGRNPGRNPGTESRAESRGGVSGGCIPCADEPALEPGLLKPLSGQWVSWNSCRLRPRGQRPPKVRCPLFPGCGYSAERLEVALGRAGRKTHSQPSGSFLTGTPHGQEAVPCELAQVGIDGGAGLGGGQERDRDTGTSEVMGTALLWAWVHSCVCVRERQHLSNCLLYMLSLLYLKFTSTKLLNFSECAFYRTD